MKKLLISFFLTIFLLGIVSAGTSSCTVPGANYCWDSKHTYGDATAHARIFYSITDDVGGTPLSTGKAVGELIIKPIGFIGDDIDIFFNERDINNLPCNDFGCNGIDPQINGGKIVLATQGHKFTDCVILSSFDCEGDCGNYNSPDYWATTLSASGWEGSGNCFNIDVVECVKNSDCSSGKACSQNSCVNKVSCPTPDNPIPFDSSLDFTLTDCNVWQYHQEINDQWGSSCSGSGWVFYSPSRTKNSMSISKSQYESITPQECHTECIPGDTKCVGEEYQTCENSKWKNKGKIAGQCGVQLDKLDYYRFENNQCSKISLLPSEVTENDFSTLELCNSNIITPPTNNKMILLGVGFLAVLLFYLSKKFKRRR